MPRGTKDLETRLLELAREAARERRVYADLIARLDRVLPALGESHAAGVCLDPR